MDALLFYRNRNGIDYRQRFGSLLPHFFNHQALHRGQASTLLTRAPIDIGVADLPEIVRTWREPCRHARRGGVRHSCALVTGLAIKISS